MGSAYQMEIVKYVVQLYILVCLHWEKSVMFRWSNTEHINTVSHPSVSRPLDLFLNSKSYRHIFSLVTLKQSLLMGCPPKFWIIRCHFLWHHGIKSPANHFHILDDIRVRDLNIWLFLFTFHRSYKIWNQFQFQFISSFWQQCCIGYIHFLYLVFSSSI